MSETTSPGDLPAGDFTAWVEATLKGFATGTGIEVPCGDCRACCTSSYFIHVEADEAAARAAVGADAIAAPGRPGVKVMGFDESGNCPKMKPTGCAIYHDRPRTCRIYDCRIFAAAGLQAGPDKARINERIAQWRFDYRTEADRDRHNAVKAAAAFILKHAALFPGRRIPADPGQLALLALKVHAEMLPTHPVREPREIVDRMVEIAHTASS